MKTQIELFNKSIDQILKTWIPKDTENELWQPKHGLLAEIGELSGKFQKKVRGDEVPDIDIKKELGDINYYFRLFCYQNDIEIEDIIEPEIDQKNDYQTILRKTMNLFTFSIGQFYFNSANEHDAGFFITNYFELIDLLGFDYAEILEINKAKLEKRFVENKIKGDGDNR